MAFDCMTRRGFLSTTSAMLGTSALISGGFESRAAEPPKRTGKPYMKLSLAAYSFNKFLPKSWTAESAKDAKLTLDGFIDYCASLDLAGTELTSYYFPKDVTPEYLTSIKERTFRLGLDISGTAIGNDFCVADAQKRQQQIDSCRKWIDHAAFMGAPVIRIFAGNVPKGDTEEVARERCISAINECLDHAAKQGVILALENHGGITATPAQLLAIVKSVKASPWFGVNYDSGNFRTDDPYADLEQIAPYAVNAQVKVSIFSKGQKQVGDLKRMVDILKAANYRGYLVLEYEEADPYGEIPGYIDQLRKLIG